MSNFFSGTLYFFKNLTSPTNGSVIGILWPRVLIVAILVFGFYNTTGNSLYHVLIAGDVSNARILLGWICSFVVFTGLFVASWKTFGSLGTIVIAILFSGLGYLAFQEGWVSIENEDSLKWFALILITLFFSWGISGSILWRKLTGQVITDEGDDLS